MESTQKILDRVGQAGVLPVIIIEDAAQAAPLAKALVAGGIGCAEITLRTPAALQAIRAAQAEVPGLLMGAGTVLTPAQADEAAAAGAAFMVTPGFNPRVVDHCIEKEIPVIPGCATPSEMEQAIERGLAAVKFFPAGAAGGLGYIKAVAAPYSMLRFVPTGGVSAANLAEYLAHPAVLACGGSWMVAPALLAAGDYDGITRLCREAVAIVRKVRSA